MRTFHLMILTCLALGLAACASDDDSCGSTSGCHTPPGSCGDDACQADKGENAQNCPADCVPVTCGDGTCSTADLETHDNCPQDCNVTCLQPDKPVYCADTDSCWPAGTDCSRPVYSCDSSEFRCGNDDPVNCCGDVLYFCWASAPYFCPDTNDCVADMADCPTAASACTLWGASCLP